MSGYRGKRVFDVVVAGALAVVLSPVMAAVAVAVRMTSPGPAIYSATRAGLSELPFRQYKFRTMFIGADRSGFRTATDDPRITRIGRSLRKSSLDELPQLWNVVRGEMSLVGPRPAALAQVVDYDPEQRRARASVRPGMTGLAQVSGRSALDNETATALDLRYAAHLSLGLDLWILARTVVVVLRRPGAN